MVLEGCWNPLSDLVLYDGYPPIDLQPLELLIFLVVVDCKKHGDAGDIARSAVSPRLSELLPREGEMDGLALAEDRSFLEIWNPRLSLSLSCDFIL
jgi:hypothetical protein